MSTNLISTQGFEEICKLVLYIGEWIQCSWWKHDIKAVESRYQITFPPWNKGAEKANFTFDLSLYKQYVFLGKPAKTAMENVSYKNGAIIN
jgi:hypothetical protein